MTSSAAPTRAPLLGEPLPVELMNTVWADRAGVHDALATEQETLAWLQAVRPRLATQAPALDAWLAAEPGVPAGLDVATARLRQLRDALRRLAAGATDDPRDAAVSAVADHGTALQVLNSTVAAAPPWPVLDWDAASAPHRTMGLAEPIGTSVVALLAAEFIGLVVDGGAPRLRACLAPGCVLYFAKDHTRREWCSTACGNRARAARHYQRRRTART